jgi:hypothetical protein
MKHDSPVRHDPGMIMWVWYKILSLAAACCWYMSCSPGNVFLASFKHLLWDEGVCGMRLPFRSHFDSNSQLRHDDSEPNPEGVAL